MRVLVVDIDYGSFTDELYATHPGLADAPYAEQLAAREQTGFGAVGTYTHALDRLGHEAQGVYLNNMRLQRAWWREHASALRRLRRPTVNDILAAQARAFRPDVLICLNPGFVDPALLASLRIPNLVGQHAATKLPNVAELGCYDLLVSSFPPTIDIFRSHGYRAEYLPLGIDADAAAQLPDEPRVHDVVFVGSFFPGIHDSRATLIETLCREFDGMRVWSAAPPENPAIRERYAGSAWGREMLDVLAHARIVVNHHGDIAPFANNARLYEATAAGALLVTDAKPNLDELFVTGEEIVAYHDADECIALVRRYLDDEPARAAIAARGRKRTLHDHTYDQIVEQLLAMLP